MEKNKITVEAKLQLNREEVWNYFTEPKHIVQWNYASEDWHTPKAENDLRVGGKFLSRMEAKDGSFGFDFEGVYTKVIPNELIEYELSDGRKVKVEFQSKDQETKLVSTFEAEDVNSLDLQKGGWQAILDNFKKYAEK